MSTGKTERVAKPSNLEYNDLRIPEETMKLPIIPTQKQKSMPKSGFRMKVQPIITASWRSYFKGLISHQTTSFLAASSSFH